MLAGVANKQFSANKQFVAKYGPWAVVTGASSGIGKAFAIAVAEKGLSVVLVARRKDELLQVANHLNSKGVETRIITANLASSSEVQRLHQATSELNIGLFIASAGFGTSGEFIRGEVEDELSMIDVNCRALAASAHHFGRRFKRSGGGIILLSSIVAFQGNANSANYSATKAYVQTLAEGLQSELKEHGVDVLACAPGPTASGFAERANMKLGMTLTPDTVAKKSLSALGRRTTVLPGFLSKLLKYIMFGLPRWARTRIMSSVMRGITKHQNAGV